MSNNNIENGLVLFEQEKYTEALDLLLPCAEEGDSKSQAVVGFIYMFGFQIERNINGAIKWLTMAANAGIGEAAHNLGTLYLTCEPEMPADKEKSSYWYNKAKELGFMVATDDWYQ